MYQDFFSVFLFIGILLSWLIWYYRKDIAFFYEVPNVFFLFPLFKYILSNKFSRDIPVSAFSFQFLVELCKKFQTEGLFVLWLFQPFVCIYNLEDFKILNNNSATINKPYVFDLFKEFMRESLLSSNGAVWRNRRKMLNPMFHIKNVKGHCEIMNKNAALLVASLSKCNTEASFDVLKCVKFCAFTNAYEFITGLKMDSDEKIQEMEEIIDSVDRGAQIVEYRIFKPWLHPRCFMYFFAKGREYLKTIENGSNIMQKILKRMKESLISTNEKTGEESNKLCQWTFARIIFEKQEKDPTFTCLDIRGELTSLAAAGYDTVSHALKWTLFLLGHHPDIQNQVYEEVESVMSHTEELSRDDLRHLKYLECVIKESLRIYPSVPMYTRRIDRAVQCGKHLIPENTNIVFFTYSLNRDPNLFPDPEKFYPERFLNGNLDHTTHNFAEGVRNCIGKNFAMMELKIILAHVLRNFHIKSLDRPEDINLCWEIVLSTVKPVRMCLTRRSKSN